MSFILNTLQHLRAVRRWAEAQGVHMHLSPLSMSMTLTRGKHVQHLQPRFVMLHEGRLCYSRAFEEEGRLAGWHPADPPSWPLAQDKLTFKKQASAMGLRVPAAWNDASALAESFILKNRAGSFGEAIYGPFSKEIFDFSQPLKQGDYLVVPEKLTFREIPFRGEPAANAA